MFFISSVPHSPHAEPDAKSPIGERQMSTAISINLGFIVYSTSLYIISGETFFINTKTPKVTAISTAPAAVR